jgi:hypothetical protein
MRLPARGRPEGNGENLFLRISDIRDEQRMLTRRPNDLKSAARADVPARLQHAG